MVTKSAKADVTPVRQRTQYSCMASSMAMALQSLGYVVDEDKVNEVMGAQPMRGAAWEQALACAQHFGCRATLTTPSTLQQVKAWTDAGTPVMIAWNPEGREWSHASLIFDVVEDEEHGLLVHVADPNIPDPDETVRIVPKKEFYGKWYEKFPNYLVRRVALAIEREITPEGRQVVASTSRVGDAMSVKTAYEIYVDSKGYGHDDEGNSYYDGRSEGTYRSMPSGYKAPPRRYPKYTAPTPSVNKERLEELDAILAMRPDRFVQSIRDQVQAGRALSPKQISIISQILARNHMSNKTFRVSSEEKSSKKDIKPITGPNINPRNVVVEQMIDRSWGSGGHHSREREVAKGQRRQDKYKKDLRNVESSVERVASRFLKEE